MSTSTSSHFLFLLTIAMAAAAIPFPPNITPRTEILKYWNIRFPTKTMPADLLAKMSPLSGTEIRSFSMYLDNQKLAQHTPSFCAAANLFCSPGNVTRYYTQRRCQIYLRYSCYPRSQRAVPTSLSRVYIPLGMFFREQTLVAGNRIQFPNILDEMPQRSFLPKSLADKFSFSSTKLAMEKLVQVFGASGMKEIMAHTISTCEMPAVEGERRKCVTSLEGMIDYAAAIFGPSSRISTVESLAGSGEKLVLGKVTPRSNGKEVASMVCHKQLFPYLVYYCHMVPSTRVYDVDLHRELKGNRINQAVAICHHDTSKWDPNHTAFVALGTTPGESEVCHFIYQNDFIWTAA